MNVQQKNRLIYGEDHDVPDECEHPAIACDSYYDPKTGESYLTCNVCGKTVKES